MKTLQSVLLLHLTVISFAMTSTTWAKVRPNRLFSDGAVLQQNTSIRVWGTAKEGEKVTVQFDGQSATATTKDGKWLVRLHPHPAGGPYTMTISGENTVAVSNVMVGEVWICSGQSNMGMILRDTATASTEVPTANYPKIRMFTVQQRFAAQPVMEAVGQWEECSPETSPKFSAIGYYFGRNIHKATGFPVGLINTSRSATPAQAWTSLTGLEKAPELSDYAATAKSLIANYAEASASYPQEQFEYQLKLAKWNEEVGRPYAIALRDWAAENQKYKAEGKPEAPKPIPPAQLQPSAPFPPDGSCNHPTALYNGMIAPLLPYAIKGVIWYQGESNSKQAKEYQTLFPALIADWREKWGQGDFPFLFVQIAPYNLMPPEIREAQLLTWKKTPNTAMTVITDVGHRSNIHPILKEPVGARLALAARALAYGEKLEYSGPVFENLQIDKERAIVRFSHIGNGLKAKDGELKGFSIAGADKKFVGAKAEIKGETVVVSSEQVPLPVAVRYGWTDVPSVNLYNNEDLPASPFRTDMDAQE